MQGLQTKYISYNTTLQLQLSTVRHEWPSLADNQYCIHCGKHCTAYRCGTMAPQALDTANMAIIPRKKPSHKAPETEMLRRSLTILSWHHASWTAKDSKKSLKKIPVYVMYSYNKNNEFGSP